MPKKIGSRTYPDRIDAIMVADGSSTGPSLARAFQAFVSKTLGKEYHNFLLLCMAECKPAQEYAQFYGPNSRSRIKLPGALQKHFDKVAAEQDWSDQTFLDGLSFFRANSAKALEKKAFPQFWKSAEFVALHRYKTQGDPKAAAKKLGQKNVKDVQALMDAVTWGDLSKANALNKKLTTHTLFQKLFQNERKRKDALEVLSSNDFVRA